jgi:Protein of unknown function (DUF3047)
MRILLWGLVLTVVAGCSVVAPSSLGEQDLSTPSTGASWHNVALPGKVRTAYSEIAQNGRRHVYAESAASASMLRRQLRIEGSNLGKVSFSWRVPELIAQADLTDRDASDSPVRLILAFEGDHGKLSLRNRMLFEFAQALTGETPPYATLMYVWDNKAPTESVIHSGRTDRIRKIVIESGRANVDTWREYERDIAADFRKAFGEEPGPLVAVGLMTDSDNTRSAARAWYGEVRIVAADGRTH